jgi:hypothetical protein
MLRKPGTLYHLKMYIKQRTGGICRDPLNPASNAVLRGKAHAEE